MLRYTLVQYQGISVLNHFKPLETIVHHVYHNYHFLASTCKKRLRPSVTSKNDTRIPGTGLSNLHLKKLLKKTMLSATLPQLSYLILFFLYIAFRIYLFFIWILHIRVFPFENKRFPSLLPYIYVHCVDRRGLRANLPHFRN